MRRFVLAAAGPDSPGIVSAVTGALAEAGCNLEDTSMTILRGHFAMMLVVSAPHESRTGEIVATVTRSTSALDLHVSAWDVHEVGGEAGVVQGEAWTVAVYGADRPGIVHRVSRLLAAAGVNIVDLSTKVIGDPDRPAYAMVLDVTLPATVPGQALRADLEALADDLGVECSLHPSEADIL